MKRYTRKIALALLVVMLFTAMAGYTYASTKDITISGNYSGNTYTKFPEAGPKEDTSALYVYLTSSANNSCRIQALGCATATVSQTTNETCRSDGSIANYVTCYVGTEHSVHSNIREHGYGFATLNIRPMGGSGPLNGKWSPDSTRPYTSAN